MLDNVPGQQFDDYVLVRLLGSGASGNVYEARHLRTHTRVAIKVLRHRLAMRDKVVARLRYEVQAIQAICHPNIVEVISSGCIDDRHFIVLELLEGETLNARLERLGRLPLEQALPIFMQCADALAAAHDRNIVHRDLKPDNIFLSRQPDGRELTKLLDFGIAKQIDADVSAGMTEHGALIGTPQYMSPEQCTADEGLDHRSDVYSLALVMYRMVTGDLPYIVARRQIAHFVAGHIQGTPRSARALVPELPALLDESLLRALSKQPQHRFASAREFAQALAPLCSTREAWVAVSALVDDSLAPAVAPPPGLPAQAAAAAAVTNFVLEGVISNKLPLPHLPAAAVRCIEELRAPGCTTSSLVEILGRDPLLAAQLVARANAALFVAARPARTLDQAIVRLGTHTLLAFLVELSARRLFESRDGAIRAAFHDIWEHSVAVAQTARTLAQQLHVDPELTYLAGLLHDIGKPVVCAILLEAERVAAVRRDRWHSPEAWLEIVATCHREVGFAMARTWKLPDEVLAAIVRSDHYSGADEPSPANLVCLANALVEQDRHDLLARGDSQAAALIASGLACYGLGPQDAERAVTLGRHYASSPAEDASDTTTLVDSQTVNSVSGS